MKGLREAMREGGEPRRHANAFDKRFRKKDGGDLFLPGHVTDFVERDAKTATKFDPDTYNRMKNRVRNTKSLKTYDIHHTVTHSDVKHKTTVVDKR